MIKKLDKLILRAFIGPFISTFFITLFVLVLQFFWLYIDDIVGKGLDLVLLAQFILYVSTTLVPLALPLAVLLSSIMTFGNLGETFELVAIKSAGIPLLRFMRPLMIASIVLCGVAFFFNNNIIPVANLKMQTMKYDIIMAKPAFDIKEGVFYDKLDGYIIKIGKKEKDGKTIRDVLIYEKTYGLQDFVIVAESGTMTMSPDKKYLQFNLQNGWRYEEKGPRLSTNTEFVRLGFKEYKKLFDLSSFQLIRTSDSTYKDNWQMLSMRQLDVRIDSLEKLDAYYEKRTRAEAFQYMQFTRLLDSSWNHIPDPNKDSLPARFDDLIPQTDQMLITERAISQATSIKTGLDFMIHEYEARRKDYLFHLIEWHRKITMSIACLVLFIVGAPLGSIIRKGGLGMPLVLAVVFFVIFFLLNNFGKKFVEEGVSTPFTGMWMATFVLTPIGIFLTYKAMRDSQLFNKESYFRIWKRIKEFTGRLLNRKLNKEQVP
ncbi:MAG TPA: LptF/LptG family permease [Parasegetibacter sp.]